MNFALLASNGADGLTIAYIIVSIMLGIAVVVALIAQVAIIIGYWRGNRKNNSLELTGGEIARKVLDEKGMSDVKVKKCTFLRMIFFGNHYSISKKTVYLRKYTINKKSLTATAMALQKVALAEQHRDGNKKMIVRSRLQGLGIFAPALFIPFVIIGILVDLLVVGSPLVTFIAIVLGLLFIVFGFIVTILNYPVEKKAMKRAIQWMEEDGLATAEERDTIRKIYRSYLVEYAMQIVVAILRLIQLILKILMSAKKSS